MWAKLANTKLLLSVVIVTALITLLACSSADEPAAPAAPAPAAPAPAAPAPAAPAVQPAATAPSAAKPTGPAGSLTVAFTFIGAPAGLPSKQSGGMEGIPTAIGVVEKLVLLQQDLSWKPQLADSFELADDLSKLTVKLRQGVQWHKGFGEFTAADVKFTYGDAGLENLESINGSVGYLNNYLEPLVVVDDYTVDMPLKDFTIDWQRINLNIVNIHSKKAFDDLGRDEVLQTMIGTGPFRMVSWTADNEFVGEAVADHWRQTASVNNLRIVQVSEASTRVAMIKTGEADIIESVPFSFLQDLKDSGIEATAKARGGRQQVIFFGGNFWQKKYHDRDEAVPRRPGFKPDREHPWIGDPDDPARMESARKVRWALSLAIDRELINKEILLGEGRPSYVPYFSPLLPEHPDRWIIPYDPEKAKQYLIEAGYPDGFKVQMYIRPDNPRMSIPVYEAVATMWANLGLEPVLDRTAYQAFRPTLVERRTDVLYSHTGATEIDTFDLPRFAAAEGSTWSEGDWNYGIEAIEMYEVMKKLEANPRDRDARVQANMELGDFYLDTHLGFGIVDFPGLYFFNPQRIAQWDLLPATNVNSLETVVLR